MTKIENCKWNDQRNQKVEHAVKLGNHYFTGINTIASCKSVQDHDCMLHLHTCVTVHNNLHNGIINTVIWHKNSEFCWYKHQILTSTWQWNIHSSTTRGFRPSKWMFHCRSHVQDFHTYGCNCSEFCKSYGECTYLFPTSPSQTSWLQIPVHKYSLWGLHYTALSLWTSQVW